MLRYVDIQTRIKRLLDEASSSGTTDTIGALVEDAVNAAHQRICLKRSWGFMLWPREESFTTVAGVRSVALNPSVGKILHVWNTNAREWLTVIPRRQWEAQAVDRSAQSQFNGAIFGGYWPVQQQPTSATALTVVSTSASDVTSRQLLIRGVNAAGDVVSETLTANGATPVTGTTAFVAILNVTKLGTWVGTASLKISTTTILTLLPGEYAKQYPTLEFLETPQSAQTFTYAFMRVPQRLVLDNDIPEIPYPFSEILVYDALLELVTYRTDVNATHVTIWSGRKQEIDGQLGDAQDGAIVGSSPRLVRDVDGASARPVRFA